MLTPTEQRLIKLGQQMGKTPNEIKLGIYNLRTGVKPKPVAVEQPKEPGHFQSVGTDITQRADKVSSIISRPDSSIPEKAVQVFGQGAGAAANAIEQVPVVKQVLETFGKGIEWLSKTKPIQAIASAIGENKTLQEITTLYDTDQNFKDTVDGVANVARLGGDVQGIVDGAGFAKNVTQKLAQKTGNLAKDVTSTISEAIPEKRTVADEILEIENNYVKSRKINVAKPNEAEAGALRIEESNVLPKSVDETGTLDTMSPGKAYDQYKAQTLDATDAIGRKMLTKEGRTLYWKELTTILEQELKKSPLTGDAYSAGLKKIKATIRGLQAQGKIDAIGNIKLENVWDEKVAVYNSIKDFTTPAEVKTIGKAFGRAYRRAILEKSKTNIGEVDKELGKYLGDLERIERLNGKKIRGGKLGKYAAQIGGNIAGGIVGNALGGPIAGAAATVVGGEIASTIKGRLMSKTFGEDTGSRAPKSDILETAKADLAKSPTRDLTSPDAKVGVSKSMPKTEEVTRLEGEIAQNVDAQKRAIKAKDFELVAKLKEIYEILIDKLLKLVEEYKKLPNKQGGFARIRMTDAEYNKVAKALEKYDTTPATVDGSPMIEKVDVEFRLEQLKTKLQRTALSKDEIAEAKELLQEVGAIDADISPDTKGGTPRPVEKGKVPSTDDTTHLQKAQTALREAKGLSPADIMSKHPDINLKRDVPITDVRGNKAVIPAGEALTPYELKGNKVLLQDGETYIVSKNQWQNIKGNAVSGEAKEFAPELKGTEESVRGKPLTEKEFQNKHWSDELKMLDKKVQNNTITNSEFAKYRKLYADTPTYNSDTALATKYESYTLPDGKNYKEVLIKAPQKYKGTGSGLPDGYSYSTSVDGYQVINDSTKKVVGESQISQEKALQNALKEIGEAPIFKSSHWDEPNVISHLRLNERTYNGKPVTFMEELQSDWAREGREKGFASDLSNIKESDLRVGKSGLNAGREYAIFMGDRFVSSFATEELAKKNIPGVLKDLQQGDIVTGKVPNHPLLKNWQIPAVKRALQEAVANKSEYFAWINGEQTSARYNLATYLKDVEWKPSQKQGERMISMTPKDGGSIVVKIDKDGTINEIAGNKGADWKGKKLDEVLGKGLADSIMSKESGTLSGDGLKFGGEWANTLYDKQVKNIVEDVTGGKVEMMDMGLPIEGKKAFQWESPSGERSGWINMSEPEVFARRAKVGMPIRKDGGEMYIITDILGDGKFKAVPKNIWDEVNRGHGQFIGADKAERMRQHFDIDRAVETFDISTKTTTQQGIRLTPEIVAKIKGEAPALKKPSGVSPFGK